MKPAELDGAALRASFTANYEAPVLLARACAAHMAAKGIRGAIVLLSSMQGVHAFEGSLAYAGPKAALVHAARILAKEFGGRAGHPRERRRAGRHHRGHGAGVGGRGQVRPLRRARA